MMNELTLNLATLDTDYERLYGRKKDAPTAPIPFVQRPPVKSALVDAEKEGRDAYAPYDEKGATFLDFSRVGYQIGRAHV